MNKVTIITYLTLLAHCISAQNKYALLIGINNYSATLEDKASEKFIKRGIKDLNGPVNDVNAIENLLQAKFGFKSAFVKEILNEKATRDNIIGSIGELLEKTKKDDVVFFFYAGHGSQVKNSLSSEADKLDETIVPADAWKSNVKDIRDKELGYFFSEFLKKGVKLTVIFDCCHSGSLEKGPGGIVIDKTRFADPAEVDVKDTYQPPSLNSIPNANYLFVSASQDNEQALEITKNDFAQGAFTYALCSALQQLPANAKINMVFQYARSILKSERVSQEPSISLSSERSFKTFLGLSPSAKEDGILVAVTGQNEDHYFLQGGYAIGISKNATLQFVEGKDTTILIVDTVIGPSMSRATLQKGIKRIIKPGVFFTLSNWGYSLESVLKIYIPEGKEKELKPADKELVMKLMAKITPTVMIKITPSLEKADYILWNDSSSVKERTYFLKSVRIDDKEHLVCLPENTKEVKITIGSLESINQGVGEIYQSCLQLAKLKGWIQLKSPPAFYDHDFPYQVEFVNKITGKTLNGNIARIGDSIRMELVLKDNYSEKEFSMGDFYYYLFYVGRDGSMVLNRPSNNGGYNMPCAGEGNRITKESVKQKRTPLIEFPMEEPTGIDFFFLLYTNRQIINCYELFNQQGVLVNSARDGNPLSSLLNLGNESFNARTVYDNEEWGLIRIYIKTVRE
jgi:hypothetical protein